MDGFISGLIVGILAGILIGPVLRSWLVWHEIESLRREAALADGILSRMDSATERIDPDRFDHGPN